MLDWRDLPLTARKRYPAFARELRAELGPRAQIIVTVPPVRTKRALRTGAYDLRALARPARLLVLAWNQHGPSSKPGPVASLAFWKQTLRTVLRAAPRSRVLMGVPTWGWQWNGPTGAGAQQATQAELFPKATETAMQRPYGALAGDNAWVESDRSLQLKLLRPAMPASPASRSGCAAASRPRPGRSPGSKPAEADASPRPTASKRMVEQMVARCQTRWSRARPVVAGQTRWSRARPWFGDPVRQTLVRRPAGGVRRAWSRGSRGSRARS